MNKNNVVIALVTVTGLLFAWSIFLPSIVDAASVVTGARLMGLGIVTGISAVATRFLIKENN